MLGVIDDKDHKKARKIAGFFNNGKLKFISQR